jgi:hypothetical protein
VRLFVGVDVVCIKTASVANKYENYTLWLKNLENGSSVKLLFLRRCLCFIQSDLVTQHLAKFIGLSYARLPNTVHNLVKLWKFRNDGLGIRTKIAERTVGIHGKCK